jgi:GTP-binding protein
MLINQTESNPHLGRMLIGKLVSGQIANGDTLHAVDNEGKSVESGRILRLSKKYGTSEIQIEKAYPGDIFSVYGFNTITVGNTLNSIGKYHIIPVFP